eukprot:jgi/Orpsp1_1/1192196/evm.model.d7180000091272.1
MSTDENGMENFAASSKIQMNYDEIRVIFNEEYYKVTKDGRNEINVQSNLIFYSEKGTTLDFQGSYQSRLRFIFNVGLYNKKVIFKNITFTNYDFNSNNDADMILFNINDDNDKFQIIFENCNFINNIGNMFSVKYKCMKSTQSEPQVLFNNCKFINSDNMFIIYHWDTYYNNVQSPGCFTLKYNNCYFENNNSLGTIGCGNVEIAN